MAEIRELTRWKFEENADGEAEEKVVVTTLNRYIVTTEKAMADDENISKLNWRFWIAGVGFLILAVFLGVMCSPWRKYVIFIARMEYRVTKSSIQHRAEHEKVYQSYLRPAVEWVKKFRETNGRLPTESELGEYCTNSLGGWEIYLEDYPGRLEHWTGWKNPGTDFILFTSADNDWNLVRQSWDGHEYKIWRH